ncbi:diguanylate cyclase (GGDEF)-like protein [Silvimonas terrae]|uniref:diguanylate cyclase n=1 Tax=Silvimonas terrae TaxID=300266 RepID=A0A840RCZ5_9NEIS|nr:diguanylate cyclase [Silvimonas terrae]MBB5190141.1 diguanylate cyclase (GGDEF)-like protein [Silvimonas terrae]
MAVQALLGTARRKGSWLRRAIPFFVVALLLNISINVYQGWQSWHDNETSNAQQTGQIANLVSARFVRLLQMVRGLQDTVAWQLAQPGGHKPDLSYLADSFRQAATDTTVFVFDKDGHLMASSSPVLAQGVGDIQWLIDEWVSSGKQPSFQKTARFNGKEVLLLGSKVNLSEGDSALYTVLLFSAEEAVLGGLNPHPDQTLVLLDDARRVVVRFPPEPGMDVGQILPQTSQTRGPTSDSFYTALSADGQQRLIVDRAVPVGKRGGYWHVLVGRAVASYRTAWWRSMYANLAGIILSSLTLACGIALLRREAAMQKDYQRAIQTISAVVEHSPIPMVIADPRTGHILLGNKRLKLLCGSPADTGQPASALFVMPDLWETLTQADAEERTSEIATRQGARHMLVQSALLPLEDHGDPLVLLSFADVSSQISALHQLQEEVDLDPLTGLCNRRGFVRREAIIIENAARTGLSVVVLALDLDHFKKVNDTWGHAAGDTVLKTFSQILSGVLRSTDLAVRLGGEEFCAVLVDTGLEQGKEVGERIRKSLARFPIFVTEDESISQTVSIGLAMYVPGEADLQATLERSDLALYAAKDGGRNRVQVYDTQTPQY